MTHGWPGSIAEFMKIIGPLTDPRATGRSGRRLPRRGAVAARLRLLDAGPRAGLGDGADHRRLRRADAASRLRSLRRAQGGDIGAGVTGRLAGIDPDHVIGYHVNSDQGSAATVGEFLPMPEDLTEAEKARLEEIRQASSEQSAYFELQSTRPQTLAYSLADSPVGQLAWIVEKFKEWTNPAAPLPDDAVDLDQLLTNVSIYWFTDTGGSSAQFYYEGAHSQLDWLTRQRHRRGGPSSIPTRS